MTFEKTCEYTYRLYRLFGIPEEQVEFYRERFRLYGHYKSLIFFPEQLFMTPHVDKTVQNKKIRTVWLVEMHKTNTSIHSIYYTSLIHKMRHYANYKTISNIKDLDANYLHLKCIARYGTEYTHIKNLKLNTMVAWSKDHYDALFVDKQDAVKYISDMKHILEV